MSIEVLTKEDLLAFRLQLLDDIKQLIRWQRVYTDPLDLRKSDEVMQLLKISKSTLQTMRSNGTIPYRKIGRSCYYAYADIEKLIIK